MNGKADKEEVAQYIITVKRLLFDNRFEFIKRSKNMIDIVKHELSLNDIKKIIMSLDVTDYYGGPKDDLDRKRGGTIWEFKKRIDGIPFYIKLKIVQEGNRQFVRCLSFHEDEYIQEGVHHEKIL